MSHQERLTMSYQEHVTVSYQEYLSIMSAVIAHSYQMWKWT